MDAISRVFRGSELVAWWKHHGPALERMPMYRVPSTSVLLLHELMSEPSGFAEEFKEIGTRQVLASALVISLVVEFGLLWPDDVPF